MTRLVLVLAILAAASLAVIVFVLRQHSEAGLPNVEDDTPWMQGFGTFSELERNSAA